MEWVSMAGKKPIKSWCANVEDSAMKQALDLARHPKLFKHVAMMGDAHCGYGMMIGGVVALNGAVSPSMVGYDIGCGMQFITFHGVDASSVNAAQIELILREIARGVPHGMGKYKNGRCRLLNEAPESVAVAADLGVAAISLGTLGGGNHFIELQENNDGFLCAMVHSGSRKLGQEICKYYDAKALELNRLYAADIPNKDLAFLPIGATEAYDYIEAMQYALTYARDNRNLIMDEVIRAVAHVLGYDIGSNESLDVHHNYAAIENHFGKNVWVHRKGATSAREDELGIIPGSSGTASYIVKGLGNADSFCSCSHGAGRTMSRSAAKKTLDKDGAKVLMGDVVTLKEVPLDESPEAYKDIESVMKSQEDLVTIVQTLTPLGNIKG